MGLTGRTLGSLADGAGRAALDEDGIELFDAPAEDQTGGCCGAPAGVQNLPLTAPSAR